MKKTIGIILAASIISGCFFSCEDSDSDVSKSKRSRSRSRSRSSSSSRSEYVSGSSEAEKTTEDDSDTESIPDNAVGAWTICDKSGKETDNVFILYNDLTYGLTDKDHLPDGTELNIEIPDINDYYSPLQITIEYDESEVEYREYRTERYLSDMYCATSNSHDANVRFKLRSEKGGELYMKLLTELYNPVNLWLSSEKESDGRFVNHRTLGSYFDNHESRVVCLGTFPPDTEIEVRATIRCSSGRYKGNEFMAMRKDGYMFYELDTNKMKRIS